MTFMEYGGKAAGGFLPESPLSSVFLGALDGQQLLVVEGSDDN